METEQWKTQVTKNSLTANFQTYFHESDQIDVVKDVHPKVWCQFCNEKFWDLYIVFCYFITIIMPHNVPYSATPPPPSWLWYTVFCWNLIKYSSARIHKNTFQFSHLSIVKNNLNRTSELKRRYPRLETHGLYSWQLNTLLSLTVCKRGKVDRLMWGICHQ